MWLFLFYSTGFEGFAGFPAFGVVEPRKAAGTPENFWFMGFIALVLSSKFREL